MQVFPLKLKYQEVLSDFIKRKYVKAYEFRLMSNILPCNPPCEPKQF